MVRRYKTCSSEESGIPRPPGHCRSENLVRLYKDRANVLLDQQHQTLFFSSSIIPLPCSVSIQLLHFHLKQRHFHCEFNKEQPLLLEGRCTNNIWNRLTLSLSVNDINNIWLRPPQYNGGRSHLRMWTSDCHAALCCPVLPNNWHSSSKLDNTSDQS